MKKLMMVAAVVIAAACANAAQFSWSALQIKDGYNSGNAGYTAANITGTAYLIMSAELSQADFMAGAKSGTYTAANIGAVASSSKAIAAGNIVSTSFNYDTTIATGGKESAYFVIFSADGKYFYTSAEKQATVQDVGAGAFPFAMQATSNTIGTGAGTWQATAVPEPTSGILLLVGIAGLALRRRKA